MLNIIKADLYRIFRGKGFYITTAILILTIVSQHAAMSSPDTHSFDIMITIVVLLMHCMLPFILFVCAADFSSKAVINVLSNGTSRVKYYLSKLILSCAFCIFVLLLNILSAFIIEITRTDLNYGISMLFTRDIMRPYFAQMLMCISATCVGVFFVFFTQKTSASIGAYLALFMLPYFVFNTIMTIFFDKNHSLNILYNFDFSYCLATLSHINSWSFADILRVFVIGAFYLLSSVIGGILLFKRSEIK